MGSCTFSQGSASITQQWCYVLVFVTWILRPSAVLADDNSAKQAEKPPVAKLPGIVCLHTEYDQVTDGDSLRFRLMRELGRQAVLIAARDELGVATRDETLGDVFPESVTTAKQDLFIRVRPQYSGAVQLQIWSVSKPEEMLPATKENKHNARVILNQTENLEPRIRSELRDKLRNLGFDGKVLPPNEKNLPPDSVEGQLLEMNFVSQFAAVRAAHAAIAEKGQSPTWLAVLARGYANLSLMTEHHWKSDTEVFAARALLYAERLAVANANDSLAHATRAYVRAIVGLHGAALDELKQIEDLRKQHPDLPALPGWFELIEPYCTFEREPVLSTGEKRPSLRQLAQRLSFEQLRAFGDSRWMFESAKLSMSACPEEYGVYAALTGGNAPLSVGRTGAFYAPAALAHFLPPRIANLDGVPTAVRDAAIGVTKETDQQANDDDKKAKTPDGQAIESVGGYAAATIPIVDALRAASRNADNKGEPSWSALGELIFEEQFVQAANYLNIAMNATESSHNDEVNSMLPAIKGHRYARHIESYADHGQADPSRYAKVFGDMQVVDPRGNMRSMLSRIWWLDDEHGQKRRGSRASWNAFLDRGVTFTAMFEAYNVYSSTWWKYIDAEKRQQWVGDFQSVSPHAPQTLRLKIALAKAPTYEQVIKWESEANEDPHVYIQIGALFAKLKHYDDAIRTYERSIKLSPTQNAFVSLANTYRKAGQEELWQPTLERFFEVESLGLEQASVHSLIANDLMDKDKWEDAEPHAAAAAETWSAWGLELASRVNEALGCWDESEKWIREGSKAYPNSSGDEWYFWCRRTGRGDLAAARKLAQSYFTASWLKTDLDGQLKLLAFNLSENDQRAAFENAKNSVKLAEHGHKADDDLVYEQLHVALIATELKETDAANAAIKETRRLSEKFRKKYSAFSDINVAVCDILEGKPIPDDVAAKLSDQIETDVNKNSRCNYEYFVGRAYDLSGNKDMADKYWKRCVTRGPFDRYNATLAGKYLSDRNKTSRP